MQEVGLNPRGKLVYPRTGANGPKAQNLNQAQVLAQADRKTRFGPKSFSFLLLLAQNLNQAQVLAQADRKTRFGPKSFSFLLLYCVCLFADICYLILRF
uniref:Uncharacterized protein n=1 Tax=Solanum tuberosum TaxID=4113 RepID=M1BN51_SOLTU